MLFSLTLYITRGYCKIPKRATIKAHPATPHLPRPYGDIPRKDGDPTMISTSYAFYDIIAMEAMIA
jgi:hypothetical protein